MTVMLLVGLYWSLCHTQNVVQTILDTTLTYYEAALLLRKYQVFQIMDIGLNCQQQLYHQQYHHLYVLFHE